jgi:hypothetical protein
MPVPRNATEPRRTATDPPPAARRAYARPHLEPIGRYSTVVAGSAQGCDLISGDCGSPLDGLFGGAE